MKPKFSLIQKLGYMTIVSLAICNILMIFGYLFLYNIVIDSNGKGFYFNTLILIGSIQIINLLLIISDEIKGLLRKRKTVEEKENKNTNIHNITFKKTNPKISLKSSQKNFNLLIFLIFVCFIISLILLCISSLYSSIPNNSYKRVHEDYRSNIIFFLRVPNIFYLFLVIAILSLTIIIFYSKNVYLILSSISIFLYCIWILPYLQIWNYFGQDSYKLLQIYQNYKSNGITANENNNIIFKNFKPRYTTHIFTAILLTCATGVDINTTLWFLYPLSFVFTPFFFYSVFKIIDKNRDDSITLIFLTILALTTGQFIKCPHSATTMVFGMYTYFILVIEFLDFNYITNIKIKLKNLMFIIFIFFFLVITHFEECIYFLILILFFTIHLHFIQIKKIHNLKFNKAINFSHIPNLRSLSKSDISYNKIQISNIFNNQKEYIITLFFNLLLFVILIIIFYLLHEFFGRIQGYFFKVAGYNLYSNFIFQIYENSRIIQIPLLSGAFKLSLFIILGIFCGIFLLSLFFYFSLFRYYRISFLIQKAIEYKLKRVLDLTKIIISNKVLQIITIFFLFFIIIMINFFYYQFLEETGFSLIIELVLNYSLIIFNIFLFLKGLLYYKIEDDKQNFFLLAILSSTFIMFIFIITGLNLLAFYIFNARFLPTLIFFNLIIIQNSYFKDFMNKPKKILFLVMFVIIFLGVFYSLNKIGWE